jgi:hypothetical protein
MMEEQRFLDDLMLDALEDPVRLWDVMALAASAFPELPPEMQRDVARRAVRTLLDRGWISVIQRGWANTRPGPEHPVDPEDARLAVDSVDTWDSTSGAPQLAIFRTERGARDFVADARRRGLIGPQT